MENIIEEKGSVSGEIIDNKNMDNVPEGLKEEEIIDNMDTLEKPEIRPKKERSQAQKDSFAKARLALQEKRRVAREKKACEPKKPRGRPVKKQTVDVVPVENTENLDTYTEKLKSSIFRAQKATIYLAPQ